MTKLAMIVVLAGCGSAPALQSDAPLQPDASTIPDLSSSLAPIASLYQLPALAALASDGSQILGQGVTGIRKIGDPTPATLGDKWHLGSDTKAMTATLVAGFVEAGTLEWDEAAGAVSERDDRSGIRERDARDATRACRRRPRGFPGGSRP